MPRFRSKAGQAVEETHGGKCICECTIVVLRQIADDEHLRYEVQAERYKTPGQATGWSRATGCGWRPAPHAAGAGAGGHGGGIGSVAGGHASRFRSLRADHRRQTSSTTSRRTASASRDASITRRGRRSSAAEQPRPAPLQFFHGMLRLARGEHAWPAHRARRTSRAPDWCAAGANGANVGGERPCGAGAAHTPTHGGRTRRPGRETVHERRGVRPGPTCRTTWVLVGATAPAAHVDDAGFQGRVRRQACGQACSCRRRRRQRERSRPHPGAPGPKAGSAARSGRAIFATQSVPTGHDPVRPRQRCAAPPKRPGSGRRVYRATRPRAAGRTGRRRRSPMPHRGAPCRHRSRVAPTAPATARHGRAYANYRSFQNSSGGLVMTRTQQGWGFVGIHLGSTTDDNTPLLPVILNTKQINSAHSC